jgi:hypothetical protein
VVLAKEDEEEVHLTPSSWLDNPSLVLRPTVNQQRVIYREELVGDSNKITSTYSPGSSLSSFFGSQT